MNTPESDIKKLVIKKYSNRRFYDTTRSCHVTLTEVHDLILGGAEVEIIDSKSGEDLTKQILTQIILERDAQKLDIFPTNVLHQMIRTQQQFLGSVLENFFGEVLQAHRVSQERWAQFLKNTLGFVPPFPGLPTAPVGPGAAASPFDWTRTWMDAWTGKSPQESGAAKPPSNPTDAAKLEELQRRLAELTKRIEDLQK